MRRLMALGLTVGIAGCGPTGSKPVEAPVAPVGPPAFTAVADSLLVRGHRGDPANWPVYGGDYSQTRYSGLDEVNARNVTSLRPAWIYQGGFSESFQTTPLVIGREMYLTTPMVEQTQRVVKIDAVSGVKLWETPIRQQTTLFCCGANNRGAAVAGERVFVATLDARLVALDAKTGNQLWETQIADPNLGYGNTSAPIAYDGKVLIGTSGGEWAIRGFLKAFDQATGKLVWTWYTIPSPEQGGWWGEWIEKVPGSEASLNRKISKEKADSAKYADAWQRGGGPIWMPAAVDPALGLALVSVGNANPDYNGVSRPGDNRWTASLCAVKIADGTLAWCYQFVPHDVWDYDGTSPPFLFEVEKGAERIPVAAIFTKLGWLYVVDRRTGKLVTRSDNYVPQENMWVVPGRDTVEIAPGSAGGTNWSPGAYSPLTKLAYTVALDWPFATTGIDERPCKAGPGGCIGSNLVENEKLSRHRGGVVAAVDPATGKVVWSQKTRIPMIGGVLTTAGGLVFAGGADGGTFDAWDARTGDHLWQYHTGAGCNAAPMTYRLNGKQYIAVACGGNFVLRRSGVESPAGGTLISFALP